MQKYAFVSARRVNPETGEILESISELTCERARPWNNMDGVRFPVVEQNLALNEYPFVNLDNGQAYIAGTKELIDNGLFPPIRL